MNSKVKLTVVSVLALLWLLAAPLAQAAERTLKFAHIFSPEHYIHKAAVRLAEVVREKTGGRIEVRVLPSEQLGNERQIMEGLQFGTIEMGYVTGNIVQGFEPSGGLLSLPYLIRDFDHAFRVEDGPAGAEMKARVLKKTRVRALGFNVTGIRVVVARDKPIRSIEDFKGLRIRVPESPIMVSTFRALGANPTPIPWGELYTSLQTKVVDAAESPPAVLYDAKIFEVAKFLSLTNHIYTDGFVMIGERVWESLSEKDRAALMEGVKENQELERKLAVRLQTETLERVKREGVTVITIDTKPMQQAVRPLYEEFAKSIGGMALIEQVMSTR